MVINRLANTEYKKRIVADRKVNETISVMGNIGSKFFSNNNMPYSSFQGVELTFDVFCDIFLNGIQRHRLSLKIMNRKSTVFASSRTSFWSVSVISTDLNTIF